MMFRVTRLYLLPVLMALAAFLLLIAGALLIGRWTENDVFLFERQTGQRSQTNLYLHDIGHYKTMPFTRASGRETRPQYAPDGHAVLYGASGFPDNGIDMVIVRGRHGGDPQHALPCEQEQDVTFSRYLWLPDAPHVVGIGSERYTGDSRAVYRADLDADRCGPLANDDPVMVRFMDSAFSDTFPAPGNPARALTVRRVQEGFWQIVLQVDGESVRRWTLGSGQSPYALAWATDNRHALLTLSSTLDGTGQMALFLLDTMREESPTHLLANAAFATWRPPLDG